MLLSRTVALVPLFALLACGTPDSDADELTSSADDLVDEASFADTDATPAELAKARDGEAFDNEMTLFALPAPRLTGLSWKSPGALARRTLTNQALKFSRSIGHAGIRVQCAATATRAAAHFQGSMVSTGDEFREMVLKEKAGLGVLFRTVPGRLEREDELQVSLDERYRNGRVSYVRMGISADTCHALLDYAHEFAERGVDSQYGFVRPLHQEGAGCSAFSMSFLKLAGAMEPSMQSEWSFDVRIPMQVIGGLSNPGHDVPVWKLFLLTRGWASASEAHLRLSGWDPTLMYESIRARAKNSLKHGGEAVEKRGKALGIVLDHRELLAAPELRDGSFFHGTPELDNDERFLTLDD